MEKITEKAGIVISEIKDTDQRIRFQSEILEKIVELKEEYQYWE